MRLEKEDDLRTFDRDLALMAVSNLLYAAGYGLYYQLLYVYAGRLGASRFTIGALSALVLTVTALGLIPGAWAAARFPLKTIIVAAWWLTVPAAICFALAPSWPWMVPGFVFSGLAMANNPAFKAYIFLKSEPTHVARNMAYVFSAYPAGLIVAPLIGGQLADHIGVRAVFAISAVIFALSATSASLIHHTPYHVDDHDWDLTTLRDNRQFRRYLVFFLAGFLALYIGQPFIAPFLAQVHHQGYGAIGMYTSIAAVGATVMNPLAGRTIDLYGARAGAGGVLVFLLAGALLLLVGTQPVVWGVALLFYGSFDCFRFTASGIIGHSFGRVPLVWGFAIFDAIMGIPMAGGALLGGVLYRQSFRSPFIAVIALAAALLAGLALTSRGGRRTAAAGPAVPRAD